MLCTSSRLFYVNRKNKKVYKKICAFWAILKWKNDRVVIQPKEIRRTEEEGRASQSDPFKAKHCLFGPFKRRLKAWLPLARKGSF